jgi:hypothetical protein
MNWALADFHVTFEEDMDWEAGTTSEDRFEQFALAHSAIYLLVFT